MRNSRSPDRPKVKPDDLRFALVNAARQKERNRRIERRSRRLRWLDAVPGWLRSLIVLLLFGLLGLAIDGIRRESAEFTASLASFSGKVTVEQSNGFTRPVKLKMKLHDEEVITTGTSSTAVLAFPDGSAIIVEPGTELTIRLLDFVRGGRRDRSFLLQEGAVIARVSKYFGETSRATICTPDAVTATRSAGFRVIYDPESRDTNIQVVNGSVALYGKGQQLLLQGSQIATLFRTGGYDVRTLPNDARSSIGAHLGRLRRYEQAPTSLQRKELEMVVRLDPVLQTLAIGPGGWGYAGTDFARRAACMGSLRQLRTHIAEVATIGLPDSINVVTLEELLLKPEEKHRIMHTFAGYMLESYQKLGTDRYVIRARARDKKRTLYQLTETGLKVLEEKRR